MSLSCVLLVDDSKSDQFLGRHLLESYDPELQVLSAFDGREALSVLAEGDVLPDVILLDINMPVMDGHAFLEAYSEREEEKSVVVIMSGSPLCGADRKKVSKYGFVKYCFLKPLCDAQIDRLSAL